MEGGKCFFHLEYQLLAVNELQSGISLHVFYKHCKQAGLLFELLRQAL